MTLTFVDKENGVYTKIGKNFETRKEIFNAIYDWLSKNYVENFYTRLVGISPNTTMVDFGSYTKFFYIDTDVQNLTLK